MSLELELLLSENNWESDLVDLFANYVQAVQRKWVKPYRFSQRATEAAAKAKVPLPPTPLLFTDKGEVRTSAPSVCLYLAELMLVKDILFGAPKSAEERAILQVSELAKTQSDATVLATFNEILADRTFFVGQNITFADLSVFARVYKLVNALSDAQKWDLNHVFRWFKHIQYLPAIEAYLRAAGKAIVLPPQKVYTPLASASAENDEKKKKDKGQKPAGDAAAAGDAKEGGAQPDAKKGDAKKGDAQQQQQQQAAAKKGDAQQQQQQQAAAKKGDAQQQQQQQQAAAKKGDGQQQQQQQAAAKKGDGQQQQPKAAAAAPAAKKGKEEEKLEPATLEEFAQLDLRVGRIVEAWKHPESENLWCEKIDIGNGEIRQIASGLQKYVKLEEMKGLVIVAVNLKPRVMAKFESNGMVICASDEAKTKVEILRPGERSTVGERVVLFGQESLFKQERLPVLDPKKKILEKSFEVMRNDDKGQAVYSNSGKTYQWTTSDGTIKAQTITNGKVS